MWGRIENSTVVEITDIDPKGRFHPSLVWATFDGRKNVNIGDVYKDGEFFDPPGPSEEEIAAYLSRCRDQVWSSQTVTSSTNAVKAGTDNTARERVKSKITYFENIGDDEKTIAWKGPDGWYDAQAVDFQDIQIAQEEIQQQAYDAERTLEGQSFDSFDAAKEAFDKAFDSLGG